MALMRYRLRTLLILMAIGPPILAALAMLPLWFTPGQAAGLVMVIMALVGAVAGSIFLARSKLNRSPTSSSEFDSEQTKT